jgi:hypothetical protein
MGGRMWFWLLWASTQVGTQMGRVVGVARAARSAMVLHRIQRKQVLPPRSVYVRPVRPNERSGLAPRHTAGRRHRD